MKKRTMTLVLIFILLIAILFRYLANSKANAYLISMKLKLLHPSATIKKIKPIGLINPEKLVFINIGEEKIFLFEFKDNESTEKSELILTDSAPGESFIIDKKDNIIIKYSGNNKEIIKQINDLLH